MTARRHKSACRKLRRILSKLELARADDRHEILKHAFLMSALLRTLTR